jgi:hypothetical protein
MRVTLGIFVFTNSGGVEEMASFPWLVEDDKNFQRIYRFVANPGDAEGRHPAAHSGLGTWVGARVASPRCPVLRPGGLSVSQGASARQRLSPLTLSRCRVLTVTHSCCFGGPGGRLNWFSAVPAWRRGPGGEDGADRGFPAMPWQQRDRWICCRAEAIPLATTVVYRTSKDMIKHVYSPAGRRSPGIVARELRCISSRERFAAA